VRSNRVKFKHLHRVGKKREWDSRCNLMNFSFRRDAWLRKETKFLKDQVGRDREGESWRLSRIKGRVTNSMVYRTRLSHEGDRRVPRVVRRQLSRELKTLTLDRRFYICRAKSSVRERRRNYLTLLPREMADSDVTF
jgi:hypothetical protein